MTRTTGRRTARLVLAAVGGLALAGCTGEAQAETIRSYEVEIEAADDGSLVVAETIEYDFAGEQRHGIVRILPDRAPFEQTRDRRYPVSDIAVERPEISSAVSVITFRISHYD